MENINDDLYIQNEELYNDLYKKFIIEKDINKKLKLLEELSKIDTEQDRLKYEKLLKRKNLFPNAIL